MPSESGFVLPLRVELLGGFRVERIGVARPVVWQRRTARTLTKLLAAHPRHSLHREEILELLGRASRRRAHARDPRGALMADRSRQVAAQMAGENGGQ